MKTNLRYRFLSFCLGCCVSFYAQEKSAVDYVNTLIGSAQKTDGGTIPSVTSPFGRTHFTAMTNRNGIGYMPYQYEKNRIIGFTAMHQAAPWVGDYGDVTFFPTVGEPSLVESERSYILDHAKEVARPYYYSAELGIPSGEGSLKAEIAGSSDGGIFRFTYPEKLPQGLYIEASSEKGMPGYIVIDVQNNAVYGYNTDRHQAHLGMPLTNFKGHFYMKFNKKIKSYGTWDKEEKYRSSTSQNGEFMGAYLTFEEDQNPELEVRVATSFINRAQVEANYRKHLCDVNFDDLVQRTRKEWGAMLARVKVEGATDDQRTIYYTALYHTLLFPRQFSEDGHYYSAMDDQFHTGISYTDYSTWDTFRALHPLLVFTAPERINPMIQSALQMYQEGGWLPKWNNPGETSIMIGTHSDAIIADAYMKGFRGYDTELAYQAMRKDAYTPPVGDSGGDKYYIGDTWGNPKPTFRPADAGNYWWDRAYWNGGYEARGGLTWYLKYGYVPVDYTSESVSRTIEFGVDDYCIAQVAQDMGKMDDYNDLIRRSTFYKNLYNPQTGFISPRYSDGRWFENPNSGYTEGSPWTYLFGAMHDVAGTVSLFGGKKAFSEKLDKNFAEGHYRHDNEPGHHYIYLYNWVGEYHKTQELARRHTQQNYTADPTYGINGNDDLGQMSAWYLFSVMGFYPVTPASNQYSVGAPQFDRITISLQNDKTLEVVAYNLSEQNQYVKKVAVNGKVLVKPTIRHEDIAEGGKIEFWMCKKPTRTYSKIAD